jgi:predicted metal-dependent hydrolase
MLDNKRIPVKCKFCFLIIGDILNQQLKIINQGNFILNSTSIPYTLKRSLKARLLWLKIDENGSLIITVPRHYNLDLLDSFLKSKAKWILKNIDKINQNKKVLEQPAYFRTVPYLGKTINILKRSNNDNLIEINLENDNLIVNLDPEIRFKYSPDVELWLKIQARNIIGIKAREFSLKTGLIYNKISIRGQKSRWGSCSHKMNLNFNWRLIMLPEPVLDYVVIHELCHLQEMNHSKKFWKLVESYCPEWKKYRKWLYQNNSYLKTSLNIDSELPD